MTDPRFDATVRVAERVAALLAQEQVPCVVIGALALAVHNYPRATEDLDLAVAIEPSRLAQLADRLRDEGWHVEVRSPTPDDPLGGVIDVRSDGADLVQVVNFDNGPGGGIPRLVLDAIASAQGIRGTSLRVVDLPRLIAFKLYAGGAASAADILALLERNDVDVDALRSLCASLRLDRALERLLSLRAATD